MKPLKKSQKNRLLAALQGGYTAITENRHQIFKGVLHQTQPYDGKEVMELVCAKMLYCQETDHLNTFAGSINEWMTWLMTSNLHEPRALLEQHVNSIIDMMEHGVLLERGLDSARQELLHSMCVQVGVSYQAHWLSNIGVARLSTYLPTERMLGIIGPYLLSSSMANAWMQSSPEIVPLFSEALKVEPLRPKYKGAKVFKEEQYPAIQAYREKQALLKEVGVGGAITAKRTM